MGKFFSSGETFRVSFPDNEWVDIKQEFTQADRDFIMSRMMKTTIDTKVKDRPEAEVEMVLGKQATLERAITAWSFQEDGKAVPITPDNISNLRTRYRDIVLAEIDRLSKEAGEFTKN